MSALRGDFELFGGLTTQLAIGILGLSWPPAAIAAHWTKDHYAKRNSFRAALIESRTLDAPAVHKAQERFLGLLTHAAWPYPPRLTSNLINHPSKLRNPLDVAQWWGMEALRGYARGLQRPEASDREYDRAGQAADACVALRNALGATIGGPFYTPDIAPNHLTAATLGRAWRGFERVWAGFQPIFLVGLYQPSRRTPAPSRGQGQRPAGPFVPFVIDGTAPAPPDAAA